jgi:hypothetical protein
MLTSLAQDGSASGHAAQDALAKIQPYFLSLINQRTALREPQLTLGCEEESLSKMRPRVTNDGKDVSVLNSRRP